MAAALLLGVACAVHAADAGDRAKTVYTRATVRSLPDAGAREPLIRLKIVLRARVPFSTLSFHVPRADLLQGLAVGDEVDFVAERQAGVNTLTRIRKVAPCVRFQPCPDIVDE